MGPLNPIQGRTAAAAGARCHRLPPRDILGGGPTTEAAGLRDAVAVAGAT